MRLHRTARKRPERHTRYDRPPDGPEGATGHTDDHKAKGQVVTGSRMMSTMSGYVYELERHADWEASPDDDWAVEMYGPHGDEQEVGTRIIDGSACVVFLCRDSQYRAIIAINVVRAGDVHDDDDSLIEVDIPIEYLALCSGWAGDVDCMLRAIDSTGGLTLGSRRPLDDDDNPMSDRQWHASLWSSLSCDIAYCRRMAEKSGHEDAASLQEFEDFADATHEMLRREYGLDD